MGFCICLFHMCVVPVNQKRIPCPETEVKNSCVPPWGRWESNPHPMEEQLTVLLTIEHLSSPQHLSSLQHLSSPQCLSSPQHLSAPEHLSSPQHLSAPEHLSSPRPPLQPTASLQPLSFSPAPKSLLFKNVFIGY